MKIVVIGGTGLIGSKLVTLLAADGHEAVAASPGTGVNTLTGEGLAEVLVGADIVVELDGSRVVTATAVQKLMVEDAIDRRIEVTVWRNGALVDVLVFPRELALP